MAFLRAVQYSALLLATASATRPDHFNVPSDDSDLFHFVSVRVVVTRCVCFY